MKNVRTKIIVIIFISLIVINCSPYKNILKNETDKIVIKIYGWEDDNFVEDFFKIEILEKDDINKTINFTTKIISPAYKCGYQGTIEYYCKNNNLIMDMEFNTSCNTIVFLYDDKLFTRRISKEGLKYLIDLIKNVPEENRRY